MSEITRNLLQRISGLPSKEEKPTNRKASRTVLAALIVLVTVYSGVDYFVANKGVLRLRD